MLEIKCFVFGPFETNTYVVSDEQGKALLVDPACLYAHEQQQLQAYLKDYTLCRYVCTKPISRWRKPCNNNMSSLVFVPKRSLSRSNRLSFHPLTPSPLSIRPGIHPVQSVCIGNKKRCSFRETPYSIWATVAQTCREVISTN